jgi:hypothetical protein
LKIKDEIPERMQRGGYRTYIATEGAEPLECRSHVLQVSRSALFHLVPALPAVEGLIGELGLNGWQAIHCPGVAGSLKTTLDNFERARSAYFVTTSTLPGEDHHVGLVGAVGNGAYGLLHELETFGGFRLLVVFSLALRHVQGV